MIIYYICSQNFNYMRRFSLLTLLLLLSATTFADNRQLLDKLDEAISQKTAYIQSKEDRISLLKRKEASATDDTAILKILDDLYTEYYVYKFDSAMTYANKGMALAIKRNDKHYMTLFYIHLAEILTLGGMYSEAVNHLDDIDRSTVETDMLFKLYYSYFSVYPSSKTNKVIINCIVRKRTTICARLCNMPVRTTRFTNSIREKG